MTRSRKPVSLVLVGIGGMGACYVQTLLVRLKSGVFRIAGAVDPDPSRCPRLADLRSLGVPLVDTLQEFYARHSAELAVIASPIQFHCEQTLLALRHGSHVLCEKPVAATVQEGLRMKRAQDNAGRFVAVGYQWSFSAAIQRAKADVRAGLYGEAKRLRCLCLWPRDESYYRRNDWAGRRRDRQGRWVLDGPANNAMAHDLHNMLFLLGDAPEGSARPVGVQGELYRAQEIENYDTAAGRVRTGKGVEILFYFSHVSEQDFGPLFFYEFEKGMILGSGRPSNVLGLVPGGRVKHYGSPDAEPMKKLWDCIRAVRSAEPLPCLVDTALPHTLAINGLQESVARIARFPEKIVLRKGGPGRRQTVVRGLEDVFFRCYEEARLPAEIKTPWARPGREVPLKGLRSFPERPR